ncbi:hypothetical protein L596_021184 [Steinernema carpocapsae]|uniref:Guanylate cyclase domain-containing protein n=1 Tax=Steinernema carpocapsae TaxID=34508 RepID=A0A4U5MVZ9_STECR|nr:hypothetical protein L596_021184 [Steinernema carpocapsae]
MLNVIYNLFDSVVEQYEVYKIETIGDAYVAVAGCPKWSDPSLHCQTMCQMALHLLSAFRDLTTKDPSPPTLKSASGFTLETWLLGRWTPDAPLLPLWRRGQHLQPHGIYQRAYGDPHQQRASWTCLPTVEQSLRISGLKRGSRWRSREKGRSDLLAQREAFRGR